jgi:hypothetical protein
MTHPFTGPHENIGSRAHRAANQHGLPDVTQGLRDIGMPWSKRPGRPLAVNKEAFADSVHLMVFYFAGVVGDVIE